MPYLGRSLALEAEKEESSSPMSFKSVLKDTHNDQMGNWVKDYLVLSNLKLKSS